MDSPVLIGRIPIRESGFRGRPGGQQLLGNPKHGGEHMIDTLFVLGLHATRQATKGTFRWRSAQRPASIRSNVSPLSLGGPPGITN